MKKLLVVSMCLSFFLCMFLVSVEAGMEKSVIVEVPSLRVRSGPGSNYRIISRVKKGDRFPVLKTDRGWHKISSKGNNGWVSGEHVRVLKQTDIRKSVIVEVPSLRVRSGPGPSYRIVSRVKKGDRFPVLKTDRGWHKISSKGNNGWISDEHVRILEQDELISYNSLNSAGQHLGTTTIPHCDGVRSCYVEVITPGARINHNIDNTEINTKFKDTRIKLACGYNIIIGRYKTYDWFPAACPDPYYIVVETRERLGQADVNKALSCIEKEVCLQSWDRFADTPVGQLRY